MAKDKEWHKAIQGKVINCLFEEKEGDRILIVHISVKVLNFDIACNH